VAPRKPAAAPDRTETKSDPAVGAFLRDLDHPLKREIERVREIVLGASPEIREGVKWNAPSFRTTEFFATIHLRSTDRVQVVFHHGAKAKDGATKVDLPDPEGLVKWLSTDRCLVTLGAGPQIAKRRATLEAIVRAWIRQM
jgi:hypothetical protein